MPIPINFPWQPAVKYFEIVGEVINPEIDRIASQSSLSRKEVVSQVNQAVEAISKQYFSNKSPVIPYQDPLYRLAYLYGTVPVNAYVVERVFDTDPELRICLDKLRSATGEVRGGTIKKCVNK